MNDKVALRETIDDVLSPIAALAEVLIDTDSDDAGFVLKALVERAEEKLYPLTRG
jgi:hypothetical protein